MATDTVLLLLSLISFAALIAAWVTAPRQSELETPTLSNVAAEPAAHTVAA
jgi:hypothetical protein